MYLSTASGAVPGYPRNVFAEITIQIYADNYILVGHGAAGVQYSSGGRQNHLVIYHELPQHTGEGLIRTQEQLLEI
jgi:hypothetical protein